MVTLLIFVTLTRTLQEYHSSEYLVEVFTKLYIYKDMEEIEDLSYHKCLGYTLAHKLDAHN